MSNMIPRVPDLARETLVVLGGAILAAFIVGKFPALRAWMREQWGQP